MSSPDPIDKFFQDDFEEAKKPTKFLKCIQILENADDLKSLFRYNDLSCNIEYTDDPLWDKLKKQGDEVTESDLVNLRIYLSKRYNFSPSKIDIYDALLGEAMKNRYHPIKNMLEGLQWDGIKRLDSWLHAIVGCEDNIYTQAVGRKLLIAAVARVFDPGCKFDYLVILEGIQGIRKGTLVETLAGNMRHYATLSFHKTDTAIVEIMQGKWFLEISEMHGFKKQEVERVKALLTTRIDTVRVAYGRKAMDYPRQSIFIGTLNPTHDNEYLIDETGNRRYWPVECRGRVNVDLLKEIRTQLFAEAVVGYKSGEQLYLDVEPVENMAVIKQNKRVLIHPWADIIYEALDGKISRGDQYTTVAHLALDVLGIAKERFDRSKSCAIGRIMSKSGWQRKEEGTLRRRVYYLAPNLTELDFDYRTIDWKE